MACLCIWGVELRWGFRCLRARDFRAELIQAAKDRTKFHVVYTPDYVALDYPGGDVPEGTGVCTDVVIRAYRKLGIDLQVLVHEDMKKAFPKYPKHWGQNAPIGISITVGCPICRFF